MVICRIYLDVTPNWIDLRAPIKQQTATTATATTTTTTTKQKQQNKNNNKKKTKTNHTKPANQRYNHTTNKPTQPKPNQTTKQQRTWLLKPRNKLDFVPTKYLSLPLIQPQTSTSLNPKTATKNGTDRKG